MPVQRQLTPRRADYPVQRNDGRWWRGCKGSRGVFLPEAHRTAVIEGRSGQE